MSPCTFPSLGEDAVLETALTKLVQRAAPGKPAFTFVFDQDREHWVLLFAVKERAEDPVRFVVFDSNVSGSMMGSVGYRLGQKIQAFVDPRPVVDLVLKNLQHAKAANACAPLCLEALEFALGEHQQDDNALTSVGIQASLTQFAQAFDDLSALVASVTAAAQPGDTVLVMSNGGFGGVHGKLLAKLAEREMAGK